MIARFRFHMLCLPLACLMLSTWAWADAQAILDRAGVQGGLVVHLGCGDGRLTASLRTSGRYVIHGLDTDAARVAEAREAIWSQGLYGPVSVDTFDGRHLPYADNLVNLLVVTDAYAVDENEMLRALTPGGAAAILDSGSSVQDVLHKPWPEQIDQWSHHCHGPDGNPVARDRVVGPPERFQWIANPKWQRAHDTDSSLSALVTAGGRVFYMVDEAPISLPGDNGLPDEWFLVCRDAFNGTLLWKIPVPQWGWRQWKSSWYAGRGDNLPVNLHRRVVATADRVYVTLGYRAPVSQLDAATGEVIRTYDNTAGTREILYHNDQLLLTVPEEAGAALIALEPGTGKVLWKSAALAGTTQERVRLKVQLDAVLNAAASDDVVCAMDGKHLVCLDRASGKTRWRVPIESKSPALWAGSLIVHGPVVLYSEPGSLMALATADGHTLWTQPTGNFGGLWFSWKDVFVIDELVWTWSAERKGRNPAAVHGYELSSGELKQRVPVGNIYNVDHHHRCYRNKATLRYLISSRRGAEFVDLKQGHHSVHAWVRGVCHLGMMPANGLLYAPPHPCKCYINEKLSGFCALAGGAEASDQGSKSRVDKRLERGPAYRAARLQPAPANGPRSADWPTFRGAADRAGFVATPLPSDLQSQWSVRFGGRLTAPVVAGGKAFVASVDTHTVYALDVQTGRQLWHAIAGGRIDSPPTYADGYVLFGSADGRLTCLRATDGALAWRFLAAPEERRMGAFGQIESAWPVHGSVLVHDGIVYCAAGRSSYLDGGIHLYGLDPATGRTRCHTVVEGPQVDLSDEEWYPDYRAAHGPGAINDVLQAVGDAICMGSRVFDRDLRQRHDAPVRVRGLGGMLDDTQFRRAFWFYGSEMTGDLYEQLTYRPVESLQLGTGLSNLLVHDRQAFYGIRRFENTKLLDGRNFFHPGQGDLVFATVKGETTRTWSHRVPIHVRAMLVAAGQLVVAGPPETSVDPADPLGPYEGRRGGRLWSLSAATGEPLAKCELPSPPIFNGLAAAGGRLFVSMENGAIACLGD